MNNLRTTHEQDMKSHEQVIKFLFFFIFLGGGGGVWGFRFLLILRLSQRSLAGVEPELGKNFGPKKFEVQNMKVN